MMKNKYFLIILLAFMIWPVLLQAQWQQTGGPQGCGLRTSLEKVGNEIWAGCYNGIYSSSNDGASWQKLPLLNNEICYAIKAFSDTVIILYLSYDASIWDYNFCSITSFDGGVTWMAPVIIETYAAYMSNAYILRGGNTLITKGMWDYYTSDDWGISWTLMTTPNGANMLLMPAENNCLLLNLPVGGSLPAGFYYSNSGVQNWTLIDSIHPYISLGMLIDSVFTLTFTFFDSVANTGIVRSYDFGATWDTVSIITGQSTYLSYYHGNFYYYTATGYQVSSDGGYTWGPANFPAGFTLSGYILLSNQDELMHIYPFGIVRYVPSQNTFFSTETGLKGENINCLETHNGILYVGTSKRGYKSSDGGATWSVLNTINESIIDFWFSGDTIMCVYDNVPIIIGRSFDLGLSWDTVMPGVTSGTALEEFNGRIYLSGGGKYSDDYGDTWSTMTVSVAGIPGSCSAMGPLIGENFFLKSDTTLFVVSNDGVIASLNNQTLAWDYRYCFWSTGANNNNKLFQLDNYLVVSGHFGLFISADSGITWNASPMIGLPLASQSGNLSIPQNLLSYNGVWIGSCGRYGLYYSNDYGNSWQQLQSGIQPFISRGGLTLLNNILYAGSFYNSIWKRSGVLETITGNVYLDVNNNGIKDNGEVSLSQQILQTITIPTFATTNNLGNYSLLSDAVADTLKLILPNDFCISNPSYYVTNGAAINRDFGIYAIPGINDLSVDITNVNVFRPGFQTNLNITVLNNGDYAPLVSIQLVLDSIEDFINSVPSPDVITGDTLTWLIDSLQFLASQTISVTTQTQVTASIGDSVHCFVSVTPVINDTIPSNNYAELHEQIVGSYDPNDKTCSSGSYFTPDQLSANEELSYTIRFQNTGNFPADFVHIKDTLSHYFDLSTFRVISSSHLMYFTLSGSGIVDFYFDNIFLPPASVDELNSHGFVKYGVKCKETVVLGNAFINTAYIYFDFNPPIITNTTTTLVAYPVVILTSVPDGPIQDNTILVYPNPANAALYIDLRGIGDDQIQIYVYDLSGNRVINTSIHKYSVNKIETHELVPGVYLGHIQSKGVKIARFKFVKSQ